ncbi:hypothetical protein ACVME8_009515 [Bradyrhizobium diazoefficiens]
MQLARIETALCGIELDPSPIEPSWIIEGNPEARSRLLSTSTCKTAKTIVCRAPKANSTGTTISMRPS